jgi:WD40 repeat protein/DNA-binding SARP family transcriptional activator/energy-coupling factor transporter ATP-binding protein EcfA2
MQIQVLGPLALDGDTGALAPRDRVVLAALATRFGEALTSEQLADALWQNDLPPSWPKVVQGCVARLRKILGRAAIETVGHGYRLAVPASDVDAACFVQAVARVEELLALHEPHRAAYVAEEALALWHGPPLAELEGWDPGRIEAERLEELRREAEELRLDALLQAGRWRDVLAVAKARIAEAPLRERRWALLALAQYQAGRQGEALSTLRRARTTLAEGLGIDPGPDLVALEEEILRQDPALLSAETMPEASIACPYLGLPSYQAEDADWYFGRQAEVATCLDRLHEVGVLAVVGPSGSGKSSLVRAGVVAALRREGRRVVVVTPGPRPMDALTALPGTGSAPVLVVDQFEEALTRCTDAGERDRFVAALVAHATAAPLVVALRADRLGDVSKHPTFAGLVERGLYLLKRMTEDDLRAAIEGPARQAGLLLEAGLVDLLVRDVEGEPGALPLLSHALRQTWLAREGRTLTVAGYHTSGGIRGAVAQTAEQVYEQASSGERTVLRDLLLRLVIPSPDGNPVRSRVPRRMLATDQAHEQIIELLVGARLVTSDENAVELAHEALTRAWPRLRMWLDDDVEGQRILRHLATAADTWDAMDRPDSELYRGARLTKALDWRDQTAPDLNATEQAFLDASQARAHVEEEAARRRRRTLVGVLAGAAAVAMVLGSVAVVQARQATAERDRALEAEALAETEAGRAEANEALARSRELAASAIAVLDDDPELSLLLSLQAAQVAEPPLQVVRALREAVRNHRVLRTLTASDTALTPGTEGSLFSAAISHDGRLLVVGGGWVGFTRGVELWDLERDERLWTSGDVGLTLGDPRFSVDGRHVVAPGFVADGEDVEDGVLEGLYVWDVRTGDLEVREVTVGCPITMVANQPQVDLDESLVLVSAGWLTGCPSGGQPGTQPVMLSVLDPEASEVRPLWHEPGRFCCATTSADARYVAFSGQEVRVFDVATGEQVRTVPVEASLAALDTDGGQLITSNIGTPTELWDVSTGSLIRVLNEHPDLGGGELAWFGRDGSVVGSATRGGEVRLSDVASGRMLETLRGHKGEILFATMSGDGTVLATSGTDATARVWSLAPRGEVSAIEVGDGGPYFSDTLKVAGGRVAVTGQDPDFPRSDDTGAYLIVDRDGWEVVTTIGSATGQQGALSPDGERFAVQHVVMPGTFGPVRIHDAATGEPLVTMEGMCQHRDGDPDPDCVPAPELPVDEWVWTMGFSPDGALLAMTGEHHSALYVWDGDTGQNLLTTPSLSKRWVVAAAFAPDGRWLAVISDTELIVYDTGDWSELARTPHDEGGMRHFRATSDGRHVVASTQTAQLAVYDTTRWERVGPAWQAHDGVILDLEVAPDGVTIASASDDGSIRIWDLATGQLLQTIQVGGSVRNIAFLDDYRLLVTGAEGPLLVVTLDLDELLAIARDRLTRGFNPEECAAYELDPCPTLASLEGS